MMMVKQIIYLMIFGLVVLSGCEGHPSKTPPIEHKFNLGDVVKHKVLGFTGQVISNGTQHWEYKHKWKGHCVIAIFPPIPAEAVEYIKANDGGCRFKVEKNQIQKVIIRECEFKQALQGDKLEKK